MKPRRGKKPGENVSLEWQVVGSNYFRNVNMDTGTVYDSILDTSADGLRLKINDVEQEGVYRTFAELDSAVRAHSIRERGWVAS